MCLFAARVVVLIVFVLVVGLRIHRVLAFLEEVLVGSSQGLELGLSPSRIVRPLLCAVCENEDCFVGNPRLSWMGWKRMNGERSGVGNLNGEGNWVWFSSARAR